MALLPSDSYLSEKCSSAMPKSQNLSCFQAFAFPPMFPHDLLMLIKQAVGALF
jgi:hypothetical protein